MRVVLDTGILIAALITKGTPPDQLYQMWRRKRFTLITSKWQLGEFWRASHYRKLQNYLKPHEAGALVQGLRTRAVVLAELPEVNICRDPDDNPLLAMDQVGEADYLVTGDKRDLLSLKKYRGSPIATARALVDILDR